MSDYAIHPEKRVDRILVNSSGTQTHPYLGDFATKGCIPAGVTKTGTFTTNNADSVLPGIRVIGTGTLFLSELAKGDHIYNAGCLRRVKRIISDTLLELEFKFPTSLTGQAVVVPPRGYYTMIAAKSTGTADAKLQEVNFAQAEVSITEGAPIAYDVTTANAAIEFVCTV
jgi:hypothetical protein